MQAHRSGRSSPSGRARRFTTALAIASLVSCVVALAVRALPLTNIVGLVIAVATPYAAVVAASGVVLAVLSRRLVLTCGCVVVLIATLGVQAAWYFHGGPKTDVEATEIRVLSSNLRRGSADAPSFVTLAVRDADVITVSELTPEQSQSFTAAGLDNVFPYSVLAPAPGARGIGLWSRFPIEPLALPERRVTIVAALLRIPGVRVDPVLASVHVVSPVASLTDSFDDWRVAISALGTSLHDFGHRADDGAVIVAGDFNSTPDMRQYRDLLTDGYRDAVEDTGAGFMPTYPSHSWLPPMITIDHVVTRNAMTTSLRTVGVRGSDHRALLATVEVPREPG